MNKKVLYARNALLSAIDELMNAYLDAGDNLAVASGRVILDCMDNCMDIERKVRDMFREDIEEGNQNA